MFEAQPARKDDEQTQKYMNKRYTLFFFHALPFLCKKLITVLLFYFLPNELIYESLLHAKFSQHKKQL